MIVVYIMKLLINNVNIYIRKSENKQWKKFGFLSTLLYNILLYIILHKIYFIKYIHSICIYIWYIEKKVLQIYKIQPTIIRKKAYYYYVKC